MSKCANSYLLNPEKAEEQPKLNQGLGLKKQLAIAAGRQIYSIRKVKGITGRELGWLLGLSQQQISRYERGVCQIDISTLFEILYILETSIDHFFSDISLQLSELSPDAYSTYHTLFFSVINVSNDNLISMKSDVKFI